MEKDDEIKGSGNSYDFGARIYDSRIARWMSTDAYEKKYPGISPYNFALNNPIIFEDSDGNDFRLTISKNSDNSGGTITLQSTIFLYGPSASEQLTQDTQAKFNSMIEVYTYIDAEGKTWEVNIELTYQYAPELDVAANLAYNENESVIMNDVTPNDIGVCDGCDGPSLMDASGFQDGDNLQYVDENLDWGTETAHDKTQYGGPQGTTIKAIPSILVHASMHNIGVNDWRSQNSIMGLTLTPSIDALTYIGIGDLGMEKEFLVPEGETKQFNFEWRQIDAGQTAESRKEKIDVQKSRKDED